MNIFQKTHDYKLFYVGSNEMFIKTQLNIAKLFVQQIYSNFFIVWSIWENLFRWRLNFRYTRSKNRLKWIWRIFLLLSVFGAEKEWNQLHHFKRFECTDEFYLKSYWFNLIKRKLSFTRLIAIGFQIDFVSFMSCW